MRMTQRLGSGMIIRQDFKTCIRAALYDTGYPEFPHGTNDGTLFIVSYGGRPYGVTAKHVLKGIDLHMLRITPQRLGVKGDPSARLSGSVCPTAPRSDAEGTDVTDLCILQFHDDVDLGFFRDSAYVLDEGTYGRSNLGDDLLVYGFLGENTSIGDEEITVGCAQLEFQDLGPQPHDDGQVQSFDGVSRYASARYRNVDMAKLRGMSGSPVFNKTSGKLAGMVIRGGYIAEQDQWNIVYIDITDVAHVLACLVGGVESTSYNKGMPVPAPGSPFHL